MRVVVVEDNKALSALVVEQLGKAGVKAQAAFTGEQAMDLIDPEQHDLVILDRGLPDMDGLCVLKTLRQDGISLPVLILTAMDDLGDKVAGLNSGADDYLVKPFEMEELIARIRALYRRPTGAVDIVLKTGNIEFFTAENTVHINGENVSFSTKEKEALERLMRLPGRVVTKDALETALYSHGAEGSENAVEVVIHRLRKKLQTASANVEIHTLRGIGYLIKEQ